MPRLQPTMGRGLFGIGPHAWLARAHMHACSPTCMSSGLAGTCVHAHQPATHVSQVAHVHTNPPIAQGLRACQPTICVAQFLSYPSPHPKPLTYSILLFRQLQITQAQRHLANWNYLHPQGEEKEGEKRGKVKQKLVVNTAKMVKHWLKETQVVSLAQQILFQFPERCRMFIYISCKHTDNP